MAAQSSILTWRIPRTEEPGELQSTGSRRVGHDCRRDLARRLNQYAVDLKFGFSWASCTASGNPTAGVTTAGKTPPNLLLSRLSSATAPSPSFVVVPDTFPEQTRPPRSQGRETQ